MKHASAKLRCTNGDPPKWEARRIKDGVRQLPPMNNESSCYRPGSPGSGPPWLRAHQAGPMRIAAHRTCEVGGADKGSLPCFTYIGDITADTNHCKCSPGRRKQVTAFPSPTN